MGYRSSVYLCMDIDSFNKFRIQLDKNVNEIYNEEQLTGEVEEYNLINHSTGIILNEDKDYVMVNWDYIKWYDDYYVVREVIDTLNELDNSEKDFVYKLIKIGEDSAIDTRESKSFSEKFDFYECTSVELYQKDKKSEIKLNPRNLDKELLISKLYYKITNNQKNIEDVK